MFLFQWLNDSTRLTVCWLVRDLEMPILVYTLR